jgi:hypothetical protein
VLIAWYGLSLTVMPESPPVTAIKRVFPYCGMDGMCASRMNDGGQPLGKSDTVDPLMSSLLSAWLSTSCGRCFACPEAALPRLLARLKLLCWEDVLLGCRWLRMLGGGGAILEWAVSKKGRVDCAHPRLCQGALHTQ